MDNKVVRWQRTYWLILAAMVLRVEHISMTQINPRNFG